MRGSPIAAQVLARRWVLGTAFALGACVAVAATTSKAWPDGAVLALVLLVPLLLPLPGLLRGDRRTHAWSTLCVAPYLIYGITETIANPAARTLAGTVLFASLAFFVALVGYLRATRTGAPPQGRPDA